MKELYERPMIMVEEFAVNRAIAACGDETSRAITFDCMIGPQRDIENVLTTNCSRKAATTTATKASASNSFNHSDVTGGTWGTSGSNWGGNVTRTYTAPSDAIGLIYFCSYTNGTSCFTVENGVVKHATSHGRGQANYHVEVAPVYGTSIEAVNTGS